MKNDAPNKQVGRGLGIGLPLAAQLMCRKGREVLLDLEILIFFPEHLKNS